METPLSNLLVFLLHKIMKQVFKNFVENPKNGRPANEYKLTGTCLPEKAKVITPFWAVLIGPGRMCFRLSHSPKMRSKKAYLTC